MLERSSFHRAFAQSLAGDEDALAPHLADPTHLARARVYRNNVVTACADAIVKNYPTVERLVGEEFMRAAAVAFVGATQPSSPVLALYGDVFPGFLETFPPAAQLPYLGDVARLDRAWTDVFFALNVNPLRPLDIAHLNESEVGVLAPGLHPSVRLVASRWNAWEIWKVNRIEVGEMQLELKDEPTGALIWWSDDGVADCDLTMSELEFLQAVGKGASLGDALNAHDNDAAALLAFFSDMLARGVFAALPNSRNA